VSARVRSIAVLAIIFGGALATIASTQTWLDVTLRAGATDPVAVSGAGALALLTPLSLATLALGLALTVVGVALRYAFGAVATVIGATLAIGAARVALSHPMDAYATAVTKATGLSGDAAIADLVAQVAGTAWPYVAAVAGLSIGIGGILTLATAHRLAFGGTTLPPGRPACAER
jgi:Tryptophan-associated transmembrane protein (Trp_oprn_chp).